MINLDKGGTIDLTKEADGGLERITIGLGWHAKKEGLFSIFKPEYDLDASVFLLQGGKLKNNADIIAYFKLEHPSGAVRHMGDNLVGSTGKHDDEQISIDLKMLPKEYDSIIITVNIYNAYDRKQHFGMVKNAYMHIVDDKTHGDLARFQLTDNYSGCTAVIFGRLLKWKGQWLFTAIGEGTKDEGIYNTAERYR